MSIVCRSSHPANVEGGRRKAAASRLVAGVAVAALCAGAAFADEGGAVRLLKTIPVPGTPMRAFDISWVDAATQRYYLADRSNAAVDVVDAKNGTFLKQIKAGFTGVAFKGDNTANNDKSGPNGVVSSGRRLFVTDFPSRVFSIDLTNDSVADTKSTGGVNRADELAYDPDSGTLLVINNADDPPFATLLSVNKTTGKLTVGARITFDAGNGVDATNGAEQPVWHKSTGKFYVSIPQIGSNAADGAVVRIDRNSTGHVDAVFPVTFCQPAGLTVGPKDDLLLGCGQVFDTAGNPWDAKGAISAAPISVIMDATNGSIDKRVMGVSGSDEVWFNSGDGHYYLAARNNTPGPVLGAIDAKSMTLTQLVPTINTPGNTASVAARFPAGTSHSVAADSKNNDVFVPLPANNQFPSCLNGCIGVFGAPGDAEH